MESSLYLDLFVKSYSCSDSFGRFQINYLLAIPLEYTLKEQGAIFPIENNSRPGVWGDSKLRRRQKVFKYPWLLPTMLCVIISHKLPFDGEYLLWPSSALTVKIRKSCASVINIPISALPFLSVLPHGIQNTLVTKQTNFTLPAGSLNCKRKQPHV